MILVRCFLMLTVLGASVAAADRPNILLFLVDDMGVGDTSVPFFYRDGQPVKVDRNDLYRTPNMEKFAASGLLFTNAYAYSVCSPTRISLMTGLEAPRHRVTTWTHPKDSQVDTGFVKTGNLRSPSNWRLAGLDRSLPLLPRLLRDEGYRTIFAGKAHFGPDDTHSGDPTNLGFDVNIAGFGGGGPGSYWGTHHYSANHRTGANVWDVPGLEKYHGTETFLSEAITREMNLEIKKAVEKGGRFFAYMSHYAVHAPWSYPDSRFVKNYPSLKGQRLAFATLVEGMDHSLGQMLSELQRLGVAEETLVIFVSDNGSAWSSNAPYRDKKGSRYEGGVRVPLIVGWAKADPNHALQKRFPISAKSVEHDLVSCVDLMPTILKIAGVQTEEGMNVDGYDISPYFFGVEGTHRPQEFLNHFPHQHRNTLFSTLRVDNWKIIYNYASMTWELYDLKVDPRESENLVSRRKALAMDLAKQMIEKLDSQNALYPTSETSGQPVKPNLEQMGNRP